MLGLCLYILALSCKYEAKLANTGQSIRVEKAGKGSTAAKLHIAKRKPSNGQKALQ
jgi:hypothetical protein